MGWVTKATTRPLYSSTPPGKRPCIHRTGGWVGPRTGIDAWGKSRSPLRFDPRTVQPVARRCTDWAIQALSTPHYTSILSTLYMKWIKTVATGWCKSRLTLDVYHSSVVITAPVNSYVQTGLHYFSCSLLLRRSWTTRFLHRDAKNTLWNHVYWGRILIMH